MKTLLLIGSLVALALGGFFLGRLRAAGPPASQPLWYSGYLEKDGAPVEGPIGIAVNLWDAEVNGNQVCSRANTETPVAKGRFRVVLPDACVDAVKANPELWIEVVIAGTDFLPRSKIAAVPYAIEAANASAAVGGLDTRLAAVERPTYSANGKTYTFQGKFCGETAAVNGSLGAAALKGYPGAKALCEAVTGCTASAHICTTEELLRHVTTGGTFTAATVWYATGLQRHLGSWDAVGMQALFYGWDDCNGFTSSGVLYGSAWVKATNMAGAVGCATAIPIACCD